MQSSSEVNLSEYTVVPRCCNEKGDYSYHPSFSSPDGDVILASKDCKVMFRTHTYILKTTSGFFRSMFSLSRVPSNDDTEVIYMNDDDKTLEYLLRMVSGLPLLPLGSCELFERVLHAAEGYEMLGAISILRLAVTTSPLASADPIHMFGICARYNWEEEARILSTRTLVYNLYDEQHRGTLERLSSKGLWRLLALHRSRREYLRQRLDDSPFVSGNPALCAQCSGVIEYYTWRELKYKIVLEMENRPLGDTVSQGLLDWPEAKACWCAKCPNPVCGRLLYDKTETLRAIKESIDKLPNTV